MHAGGTKHSALTPALCLSTISNLTERGGRTMLKSLVVHRTGVVLLCGSIVTAGLSSVPNTVGNETKAFFHFAACKRSDSSCKAEVSHPSVHTTPYINYPMMPLESHVSLWPVTKDFSLSFFVLCVLLSVLGECLVRNCPYQPSRPLSDFRFSKTEWLPLSTLPQESSSGLENPLWVVVLTLNHTSPLSFPFMQSSRNNSFSSSFAALGGRGEGI